MCSRSMKSLDSDFLTSAKQSLRLLRRMYVCVYVYVLILHCILFSVLAKQLVFFKSFSSLGDSLHYNGNIVGFVYIYLIFTKP